LVGWGPIIAIAAIAVIFLILAVLLWRNHKVWRWVFVFLFLVFGLGAVADYVNTRFSYFDTVADLVGIPNYPTGSGTAVTPGETHPEGVVVPITINTKASNFSVTEAKVFLPPQYFTDLQARFPVIVLIHGNPGDNQNWTGPGEAPKTGLTVAQGGKPVIIVMPTVLQNAITDDNLCIDTAAEGKAETYVVEDVVRSVDAQLRTIADAKHRGVGGLSMGGFCALNLGLKHPDVFSVVLDFSGDTEPVADTLPGGLQQLFGPNYQQQVDANSPSKYWSQLDGSKGPAIWMDCGTSDTAVLKQLQTLLPQLKSKGFTVELHTRPGAHDFATWQAALRDSLPWAVARFYS
jgi:S-formylglutathione hydrolase FrmB